MILKKTDSLCKHFNISVYFCRMYDKHIQNTFNRCLINQHHALIVDMNVTLIDTEHKTTRNQEN